MHPTTRRPRLRRLTHPAHPAEPTQTTATRYRHLGPDAPPADLAGPKATGLVTLPLNVSWSGPPRTYNLAVPADRPVDGWEHLDTGPRPPRRSWRVGGIRAG